MSARGRFDARPSEVVAGRVVEYAPVRDGAPLSYADAVDLLSTDAAFRTFLNDLLADAPFDAFRWETPPVTRDTVVRPFEFVLLDTPSFAARPTDTRTFAEHFTDDAADPGVVVFDNLGGDATLVVPSPRAGPDAYGHLAAFVRRAPPAQRDALWQRVGEAVARRLGHAPVWLSTAGGGVAWLHVRLDARPKYYGHAPYARAP